MFKRSIIKAYILLGILAMAFLWRTFFVAEEPWLINSFRWNTLVTWSLTISIVIFGLCLKKDRIIGLLVIERSVNFLCDIIAFNTKWTYPEIAGTTATFCSLFQALMYLWFFGAVAFNSRTLPLVIFTPFFVIFVFFFRINLPADTAGAYTEAYAYEYVRFYVQSSLVLLCYIGYRYIVKNDKYSLDGVLILAGWLAMFMVSQFAATDAAVFDPIRFVSYSVIKMIIYVLWLAVIIRRCILLKQEQPA